MKTVKKRYSESALRFAKSGNLFADIGTMVKKPTIRNHADRTNRSVRSKMKSQFGIPSAGRRPEQGDCYAERRGRRTQRQNSVKFRTTWLKPATQGEQMWKVVENKFNGQTAYEVVRVNEEGRETFRMCAV